MKFKELLEATKSDLDCLKREFPQLKLNKKDEGRLKLNWSMSEVVDRIEKKCKFECGESNSQLVRFNINGPTGKLWVVVHMDQYPGTGGNPRDSDPEKCVLVVQKAT